jgi:ABC-2 type transport system ATP-binding protein
MSIEVAHLSKTYGEQKAVNNISFKVNKGEIVGFLGPNGAGKSTTMKMITGFLEPDHGEISVSGIDAFNLTGQVKFFGESNSPFTIDHSPFTISWDKKN